VYAPTQKMQWLVGLTPSIEHSLATSRGSTVAEPWCEYVLIAQTYTGLSTRITKRQQRRYRCNSVRRRPLVPPSVWVSCVTSTSCNSSQQKLEKIYSSMSYKWVSTCQLSSSIFHRETVYRSSLP
jgi:hypothetical protein